MAIISKATATKRLQWAKDNSNQDWRRIIFPDEVSVELGGWRRRRVIRPAGEGQNPGTANTSASAEDVV